MGTVLGFPTEAVATRAKVESLIKRALEAHTPETREKKLKYAIDTLSKYETGPLRVTVGTPEGEPFSVAQIDAIRSALESVRRDFIQTIRKAVLEIVLLKIAVIDLESQQ
jgi:hypothetical protein